MKVLVTGASGFLGKEVVNSLLEKEIKVFCLARRNNFQTLYKNNPNISFIEADICDEMQIKRIAETFEVEKIDAVIQTAGLAHQFGKQIRERFWEVNVKGTENIAELAVNLNCKRFVLISSVAVYGANLSNEKGFIDETAVCNPKGFYAESKFESEKVCKKICQENNLPLTVLRPSTIIGEEDRGNVFRLIKLIDKGFFVWFGKGKNRKSLIYKKDVARACIEILEKSIESFETYNLTAEPISMETIVNRIFECLNKKQKKLTVSEKTFGWIFGINERVFKISKLKKIEETLKKWTSDEIFSGESIKKKYGFEPSVEIIEAIKSETDWYLSKK